MVILMQEILSILEKNGKLTADEIAVMLGRDSDEVAGIIRKLEEDGAILGYTTLINWEKT